LRDYPEATWMALPQGGVVVTVPGIPLQGWSKPNTTVYFVLPLGYPAAKPDCFYVDADVRLPSGALPHASGMQQVPGLNINALWFSWHVEAWNPNSGSALTWMGVIRQRLQKCQ